jgi:hypothetical protein
VEPRKEEEEEEEEVNSHSLNQPSDKFKPVPNNKFIKY